MEDELLLDSSYLFPLFGVKLEYKNFESAFPSLSQRYFLRYNPVSLIEAKWYVLRESKRKGKNKGGGEDGLLQSYRTGISSLVRDRRIETTTFTNEKREELSDILLSKFHINDYFDRLIYSTAADLNCTLLTEDGSLHLLFNNSKKDYSLAKPQRSEKMEGTCRFK